MPCIVTPKLTKNEPDRSYCGKIIHINTPYFHNVENAYKGNKPICPKCRKVLKLDKKVVEKDITSIDFNKESLIVYFNDKTNRTLELDFSIDTGFSIKDYLDIEEKFFEAINKQVVNFTKTTMKTKIKHLNFDKTEFDLIELFIKDAKEKNTHNLDFNEINKLEEISEKLKYHVLFDKLKWSFR